MAKKPKILPSVEWLEPRVKAMRVLSLLSFFALAGLLAAYYLLFADLHGARPWVILLVELIPWIVLAPAMIMGSEVLMPWPISGRAAMIVILPSGAMRRNASGTKFPLTNLAVGLATWPSAVLPVLR